MIRNAPKGAAVYGVDLGKNLFHVVGLDGHGAVIQRVKFRRDTLLAFFERAERTIVGMEACPGFAMAGAQAAGDGASGPHRACTVREALYQVAKERYPRC